MPMEGSHPPLSVRKCEDGRPQPERNTHYRRTLKLFVSVYVYT